MEVLRSFDFISPMLLLAVCCKAHPTIYLASLPLECGREKYRFQHKYRTFLVEADPYLCPRCWKTVLIYACPLPLRHSVDEIRVYYPEVLRS